MAEPKKKANTRKTSSRGKNSQNDRWNDTETQADTSFFRAEVIMICTFAVAVFLFFSNFKICGVVGNFFRQLQLGVFGSMGFAFPLLMCLGICFYISNRGNIRAVLKITGCLFCLLSLCGFTQMLFGGGLVEGQKILQYYMKSAEKGIGGGLLGGLLAIAFGNMLGKLGTYLLLTVMFILGMVFLTEKSFVALIRRNSSRAYQYAKRDVNRRREEYGQQRAERKAQENRRVATGVDLKAATLKPIPLVQQEDEPEKPTSVQGKTHRSLPDMPATMRTRAADMAVQAAASAAAYTADTEESIPVPDMESTEDVSAKDTAQDDRDKENTGKKDTEFIFMEKTADTPDTSKESDADGRRTNGAAEERSRGKVIDFDAVERAARRARLKQETQDTKKAESEEVSGPEKEEKPLRRADIFVGRINHPFLSGSVDEFDDTDVERILAMQEEEKKNLPPSPYAEESQYIEASNDTEEAKYTEKSRYIEEPKKEMSTYRMDETDSRRQQNKSQDFVSWTFKHSQTSPTSASSIAPQVSFGWSRKEAGKPWEPMMVDSTWKNRRAETREANSQLEPPKETLYESTGTYAAEPSYETEAHYNWEPSYEEKIQQAAEISSMKESSYGMETPDVAEPSYPAKTSYTAEPSYDTKMQNTPRTFEETSNYQAGRLPEAGMPVQNTNGMDAPRPSQVVLEKAPDESFYQDTSNHIFVPEQKKTVVTAGGKIIEAETSLLQKKLEEKRSAAVTGMDTSIQLPQTQRIRSKSYGYEPETDAGYSGYSGRMPSYGEEGIGRSRKEFKPRKDEFENAKPAGPTLREQMRKQEDLVRRRQYAFPPDSLLTKGNFKPGSFSEKEYRETAIKLQQTLQNFGVGVTVTDISCGPAVTRYELHPEQGVKVSRIVSLQDDIKLSLAAADIRIEAPIPGKSAVGIEVPNKENSIVRLRDILESSAFKNHPSRLAFAVGKDIAGKEVVTDIAKMPHLLIAGATGSGKSVCINTLIMSILYKASPEDVKLIMVDPKVVELSVYNGIPHLLIPVVTDPKKASAALNWAVVEMTDRYKKFADYNVRDLKGYNAKIDTIADIDDDTKPKKMPQIVIIIDELADLMMVAPGEVEESICRLAQLARAAGIHLVIATQRPSVNVITGLIKANVPSRIAFAVSSGVDSRTIIDMNGAEKLLGKGDMLFYPSGIPKPIRVQGAFVSDAEVTEVVEFLSQQGLTAEYDSSIEARVAGNGMDGGISDGADDRDAYFAQAGKFIIEKDKASIGMLQRVLKIGFNRAARIMDQLAEAGVVGEEEGTKPRKVLMTMEEFEEIL